MDSKKTPLPRSIPKVKFSIDGDNVNSSESPNDSISSNDSIREHDKTVLYDNNECYTSSFGQFINDVQQFNLDPVSRKNAPDTPKNVSPYRKFIEHIMKTRGLGKSLTFLHRLHHGIVRKVQITLEKPGTEDVEFDLDIFDNDIDLYVAPLNIEQIDELKRLVFQLYFFTSF